MRTSANTVILLLLVVSAALGLAPFFTCAAALRRSHRLGLAVTVLVPSVGAFGLGLAVAVLVPSVRASGRLGLATSRGVVVGNRSILADARLHILREDHRIVALRRSEAVSMLVGLHMLGANTFIVFRNLGVRAGRRRLGLALSVLDSVVTFNALGLLLVEYLFVGTGRGRLGLALSVLDSVLAFDTDVLVLVEDLFMSALRSADVLVVWLEAIAMVGRVCLSASCTAIESARPDLLLVDAHTMTLVVPLLVRGALHDAHVLVVFIAKNRSKPHDQLSVASTAAHMSSRRILRTVPCTDTCWSTC
jgi:hypothetical protein